jgi:glycosidase
MLKRLMIAFVVIGVAACTTPSGKIQQMQMTIDSLETALKSSYKPGFGEFMSGIQVHHAKLWFAGQNQNWPLADFEVHEIQEALADLQQYCTDRPESKSIPMILPFVDSVNKAIQLKDPGLFKSSFISLTNTCNQCHRETNHGFNVVIIPTNLPVVNQEFKPNQP